MNRRMIIALLSPVALAGCLSQPQPEPDYRDLLAMPAEQPVNGAIFASYQTSALIEDPKARNVGDVLTVLLMERTDASKKATTSTKKETSVENANPTLFGQEITAGGDPLLSASVEGDQNFRGEGGSSQSNSLAGTITVTVVERYPNGNLKVAGRKQISLNQGSEFVTISGIVRPIDISTNNTITSDRLALSDISYGGRGAVNDANSMGWLARFFNSPWAGF
ncbi:MAG: flagellar basal body L-ring protein FlgH [Pseudomonadales bacterium]